MKAAAEKAIALHREGKKPVIALENTMGSFLAEYVEKHKLKVGDPVKFTYNDILKTALERSRRVSFKDSKGKSVAVTVELGELDLLTRNVYTQAEAEINKIDLSSLPASPIDYMLNELKKAGIEVAEITGRGYFVDYSGSVPVLGQRSAKQIKDRRKTVDNFNNGNIDALILNAAGSTGLSIHASERFKDQSPRHMIVAQPMLDINVLMQMLGRINRTGQVELPEFTFLSLDLPSEIRPTATTKAKMAKLNANTSANDKSDTSFEAPDFMNKYGDQVVNEFLQDNPIIAQETGISGSEDSALPDLALRFTGRLALLDAKKQRQAMDEILALYAAKIDYLNSVGMNDLVSQDLPLDAYILESKIVHEGKDPNSVFAGHTTLHKVNAKYLGKPPTASEVAAALKKSLQGREPLEVANAIIAEKEADSAYLDETIAYVKKAEDEAAKKLAALEAYREKEDADQAKLAKLADAHTAAEIKVEAAQKSVEMVMQDKQEAVEAIRKGLKIGDRMVIDTGDESSVAVVVDIKNTHKKGSGNPWAASKLKLTLMVNSGARQITVNYRQLKNGLFVNYLDGRGTDGLEEIFNPLIAEDRREIRYIATGNLIAGAAKLRGKIVNFTDRAGLVHQGILLPRKYGKEGEFEQGDTVSNFVARDPEAIAKFLQGEGAEIGVKSPDKAIKVSAGRDKSLVISLPLSNKNKTVFAVKLDRLLRDIVGDFYSQGSAHVAKIPGGKVTEAIKRLIELTPLTIPSSMRKQWEAAGGNPAPEPVMSFDGQNFQAGAAPGGQLTEAKVPDVPKPAPNLEPKEKEEETGANGRIIGDKFITDAPTTIYTTKKGKDIEGVIAKGVSLEEIKRHVDPYAWPRNGGVFVRLKHVEREAGPKFSLGENGGLVSDEEVRAVINRVQSNFGAKLKITAVASAVELPP
ncbi:MAG TPA: strawberry notch C-terminal domain-containing protein, partial [Marinagarivorans sp.]|nr:strawberry notch C-terminal domain-containing protein [Marinagarivorans sp.]